MIKKKQIILFLCFMIFYLVKVMFAETMSIQKVTFRQVNDMIEVYYDLSGSESSLFEVKLQVSQDSGKTYTITPKTLEGDIGKSISSGKGKKVVWNVTKDYKELTGNNFVFKIVADDINSAYSNERVADSVGVNLPAQITGKDGAPMVLIPAGEFMMGSDSGWNSEKPPHKVYLDAYYIDKYEVTFEQYDKFCGATGRSKPNDDGWGRGNRPVINVSWNDAVAYAQYYSKRLPTEAEWEKAAKGGQNYTYSGSNNISDVAWYDMNSGSKTHPVGEKTPNGFGLYDMSGNVWEWCADWYYNDYYSDSPTSNPKGPDTGSDRVLRGGNWAVNPGYCRSTNRNCDSPLYGFHHNGFRCVLSAENQ